MNENKNIKTDNKDILTHCPLCGSERIEAGTCMRCGLVFSKYYEVQARKRESFRQRRDQNLIAFRGKKHNGIISLVSLASMIMISIVGFVTQSNSQTTLEMKNSKRVCESKAARQDEVEIIRYDETEQPTQTYVQKESPKSQNQIRITSANKEILFEIQKGKELFENGITLTRQNDFKGAINQFQGALTYLSKSGHVKSITLVKLNLAICFQVIKDFDTSFSYFQDVLSASRTNGLKKYEVKALQGISLVYNKRGEYQKALMYLEGAIAIHEELQDQQGVIQDWLIKGIIKKNMGSPDAEKWLRLALNFSKENHDTRLETKAVQLLNDLETVVL